jgi:hypothetical protein
MRVRVRVRARVSMSPLDSRRCAGHLNGRSVTHTEVSTSTLSTVIDFLTRWLGGLQGDLDLIGHKTATRIGIFEGCESLRSSGTFSCSAC